MRRLQIQIAGSLLVLAGAFVQVRGADVETVVPSPVVVFNSFGPGNTHTTTGWGVSGAGYSGGYRGQAEWFVPGISGDLSSVEVALFRHSGSGLSNFYLTQDNGGIPGPILEVYLNVLSTGGLLALNSVNQPLLDAGAKYWVCAEPADSTTSSGWYENNQGLARGFAFERSKWGWSFTADAVPNAAFRVSVTPVPEPSTWALLVLAGCFLTVRRVGFLPAMKTKQEGK